MSVRALTIVFDSTVGSSTLKSVLVALADRMDDKTGYCFPSIADTVARTELDRKTVIDKMEFLNAEGIIIDTGERTGRTKQIPIWRLDLQRLVEFSNAVKESQKRNGSENGTGTISPQEESHFSAETVPKTEHGTTSGTIIESPPPPPAIGNKELTKAELDAIVKAAVWYQKAHGGGAIKSEAGYKHAIRKRITQSGATDEDMEILEAYRKAHTRSADVPDRKAIPNISPMTPATPEQFAAGDAMLQRVRQRVRATRAQ